MPHEILIAIISAVVGGIITLAFEEEGTLVIETNAADEDFSGVWLFNNVEYRHKYIHINKICYKQHL